VSPGKTVVNGNAADVYYRTQEREKEETNTKKQTNIRVVTSSHEVNDEVGGTSRK